MFGATRREFAFVITLSVGAVLSAGCSGGGASTEDFACADGTTLEVRRADQPDEAGNTAVIRRVDAEGERLASGRVTDAELDAALLECQGP